MVCAYVRTSTLRRQETITSWKDTSGQTDANRDLTGSTTTVTYDADGVDGKPAAVFSGNMNPLSKADLAVTTGGTVTAACVMKYDNIDGGWDFIIGHGHDTHWMLRRTTGDFVGIFVKTGRNIRAAVTVNTDMVVVGRVNGGNRDISTYAMDGSQLSTAASSSADDRTVESPATQTLYMVGVPHCTPR